MMLTRCPYCGTTFRVTPEQLKIRQGQVRCGKCRRVFDALRALVEERSSKPSAAHPPAAGPEPAPSAHAELSWTFVQPAPPGADLDEHEPITVTGFTFVPTRHPETVTPTQSEAPAGFSPVAEVAIEGMIETDVSALAPDEPTVDAAPSAAQDGNLEAAAVDEPIEFITIAEPDEVLPEPAIDEAHDAEPMTEPPSEPERAADVDAPVEEIVVAPLPEPVYEPEPLPYFDPGPPTILDLHVEEAHQSIRWPWVVGSLFAALLLASQLLIHYRSTIIAQQPETRPTFLAICEVLGCEVSLPKDVNLIGIDSSDLSPNAARPGVLRLTATLRNRAAVAQSWPHLEVTLTSAQELPLLRRALAPEDYLPSDVVPDQGFPARSEQVVQLSLTAADVPAVGYRLYIFYP